nr:E3 ubiquitin-protein ligase UBR4-like [Lytechinus pictus]
MAATSGGVNWGSVQKILITASNTTFKSSDVPRIVDAIHESKSEILKHDDKYENFYSCFVALSAHYIADHSSLLSKSVVGSVVSACHVLMDFCLQRMLKFKEACSVSQRNLMSLIEGLCTGVGQLQRSNVVTLTAMLKTAKMPVSTKQVAEETTLIKVKETPSISRADFVKQLMSAFKDTSTAASGSSGMAKTSANNEPETLKSIEKDGSRSYFASRNIDNLHSLRGADILLDVCLNLPFLQRYINNYKEATTGQGFVLPNTFNDANSIKANFPSLLNDMTIVNRVLDLPTLEPMTAAHLEKVATVIMSCLYAAIAAAVASSIMSAGGSHARSASESRVGSITTMKEEELESICNSVVLKGLSLFEKLTYNIKSSTRASGHHLQNLYLMGAWCALGGMDHILTLTAALSAVPVPPEKGKDKEEKPAGPTHATPFTSSKGPGESGAGKVPPAAATASKTTKGDVKDIGGPAAPQRPTSARWSQGFSSLTVALSSFVLKALTQLLEDLHIERLSQVNQEP